RVDVENLGRADDCRNVQITLGGRGWTDAGRFVSETNVQGIAVNVAVHCDGANAHLFTGPDNAAGNLAAIGDQDLAEFPIGRTHVRQLTKNSTSNVSRSLWTVNIGRFR